MTHLYTLTDKREENRGTEGGVDEKKRKKRSNKMEMY